MQQPVREMSRLVMLVAIATVALLVTLADSARAQASAAQSRPASQTASAAVSNPMLSRPHTTMLELPSGIRLQYVVQGRTDGIPVVLLHGLGDSWHSWELVLRHMPASYRVFAVTMRGHGWSDKPAKGYGTDDFAGDIRQFLEALD